MFKPIACLLVLASSVPAAAESRVVRYDDLNLASPAGMERLERRINAAARSVCGANSSRASTSEYMRQRDCTTKAKAGARQQVAALNRGSARGG